MSAFSFFPPALRICACACTPETPTTRWRSKRRLNNARGEVRKVDHYQYAIINDNLELAYTQLQSIVRAEKQRTSRFHPHILDD